MPKKTLAQLTAAYTRSLTALGEARRHALVVVEIERSAAIATVRGAAAIAAEHLHALDEARRTRERAVQGARQKSGDAQATAGTRTTQAHLEAAGDLAAADGKAYDAKLAAETTAQDAYELAVSEAKKASVDAAYLKLREKADAKRSAALSAAAKTYDKAYAFAQAKQLAAVEIAAAEQARAIVAALAAEQDAIDKADAAFEAAAAEATQARDARLGELPEAAAVQRRFDDRRRAVESDHGARKAALDARLRADIKALKAGDP